MFPSIFLGKSVPFMLTFISDSHENEDTTAMAEINDGTTAPHCAGTKGFKLTYGLKDC